MSVASAQIDTASGVEALRHALLAAEGLTDDPPPQVSAADVSNLTIAELRACLDGVLIARHADQGLESLFRSGVFGAFMPEVIEIEGLGDGDNRHKDVWKHTKQVVIQSVPRLAVRWAAFLHDIGKPRTRSVSPDGKVHFLHHPEVGARMFDRIERRLGLFKNDKELQRKIRFLVLHHQRAHQYESEWTDSAIRRFGREMGEHLPDLVALSRADMTTKRREKRRNYMFQLKELTERIEQVQAEDAVVPPLPKGLGDEITRVFAIPPSRKIGDIRRALEQAVEAGEILSHQPSSYYVELLAAQRERFGLPAAG